MKNTKNKNEAYIDKSKSKQKKIIFVTLFLDMARRGVLPKNASIDTAEIAALKDIYDRKDEQWIICTYSQI